MLTVTGKGLPLAAGPPPADPWRGTRGSLAAVAERGGLEPAVSTGRRVILLTAGEGQNKLLRAKGPVSTTGSACGEG